eukprot:TRINITY_DN1944_c0_g1_i1.p1 TRINITY_DN1944_c0_g1~~TRINITY_DN1944_c0_g1_i1.p1  ORF type:complete len:811 (-),score=98.36 TRINITY_DN1944_c0_g1_i1:1790-4222(-)
MIPNLQHPQEQEQSQQPYSQENEQAVIQDNHEQLNIVGRLYQLLQENLTNPFSYFKKKQDVPVQQSENDQKSIEDRANARQFVNTPGLIEYHNLQMSPSPSTNISSTDRFIYSTNNSLSTMQLMELENVEENIDENLDWQGGGTWRNQELNGIDGQVEEGQDFVKQLNRGSSESAEDQIFIGSDKEFGSQVESGVEDEQLYDWHDRSNQNIITDIRRSLTIYRSLSDERFESCCGSLDDKYKGALTLEFQKESEDLGHSWYAGSSCVYNQGQFSTSNYSHNQDNRFGQGYASSSNDISQQEFDLSFSSGIPISCIESNVTIQGKIPLYSMDASESINNQGSYTKKDCFSEQAEANYQQELIHEITKQETNHSIPFTSSDQKEDVLIQNLDYKWYRGNVLSQIGRYFSFHPINYGSGQNIIVEKALTKLDEDWQYNSIFRSSNKIPKDVKLEIKQEPQEANPVPIGSSSDKSVQLEQPQAIASQGVLGQQASSFLYGSYTSSILEEDFRSRRNSLEFTGVQIIRFNELRIGDYLGQGSRGTVYKGSYMFKRIVIKMMDLPVVSSIEVPDIEQQTRRNYDEFLHEVETMMMVSRFSCFVQICGVVLEPLCIVMEEAEQGSLFNLLHGEGRHTPIGQRLAQSLYKRLKIALETAEAINILHNNKPPILHLDIKTQNLLLSSGHVKIADFDLARRAPVEYVSQGSQGTPQYMAHEVLSQGILSDKADVYSFGVVLYELLTKQVPWNNVGNGLQVFVMVALNRAKLEIPSTIDGKEVDRQLVDLIGWCWTDEPNDRPSFKQVIVELMQIIDRMKK